MLKNSFINNHKKFNNKFFGRWAKLYDLEKYFFSSLRKRAANFIDLKSSKKILDVATGTGALAYELSKLGHDVIGVDLSPDMLKQAIKKLRPNLKLRFIEADGTSLPFKDNSFDVSTISIALHDMPYEIELLVLKEMRRCTKKNGLILIVDYNEPRKHLVAKLTHPLISLYETPMYKPFINRGIYELLIKANLDIYKETNFLGVSQILLIKNHKN